MPWTDHGIQRVRVLPEYREASASVASIDSPGPGLLAQPGRGAQILDSVSGTVKVRREPCTESVTGGGMGEVDSAAAVCSCADSTSASVSPLTPPWKRPAHQKAEKLPAW